MAKLQNPGNRIDAIRQDYRDKHNLPNSSVLIGRKFERQVENKNGEKVFDKNGKIVTCKGWYEELICLIYSALQNVYHFRKLDTIQMYA